MAVKRHSDLHDAEFWQVLDELNWRGMEFGRNFSGKFCLLRMFAACVWLTCAYICSDCSFLSKSLAASAAGAVAVVIRDNDISDSQMMIDMIDDGTGRPVDIAAFFMHGKDG